MIGFREVNVTIQRSVNNKIELIEKVELLRNYNENTEFCSQS